MAKGKGFAEEPQQPFERSSNELKSVGHVRLKIGEAGRIVIPAEMRVAMMVKPGDTVVAQVVEGELRLASRAVVLKRVREAAKKVKARYPGVDLVDEFIAERHEEARREAEEADAWRRDHGLPPLD